jgi:DNA (cytosine-5)-methyltransferase 1
MAYGLDSQLNGEQELVGPLTTCSPTGGAQPARVAQPYTLAIRGRQGEPTLEARNDGTANAILTPNGGRGGIGVGAIATGWAVRRLTPRECERLQGFPDDYTLIPLNGKMMADGPRYKMLGNSMAVPVMRWIGERINKIESIITDG